MPRMTPSEDSEERNHFRHILKFLVPCWLVDVSVNHFIHISTFLGFLVMYNFFPFL